MLLKQQHHDVWSPLVDYFDNQYLIPEENSNRCLSCRAVADDDDDDDTDEKHNDRKHFWNKDHHHGHDKNTKHHNSDHTHQRHNEQQEVGRWWWCERLYQQSGKCEINTNPTRRQQQEEDDVVVVDVPGRDTLQTNACNYLEGIHVIQNDVRIVSISTTNSNNPMITWLIWIFATYFPFVGTYTSSKTTFVKLKYMSSLSW